MGEVRKNEDARGSNLGEEVTVVDDIWEGGRRSLIEHSGDGDPVSGGGSLLAVERQ